MCFAPYSEQRKAWVEKKLTMPFFGVENGAQRFRLPGNYRSRVGSVETTANRSLNYMRASANRHKGPRNEMRAHLPNEGITTFKGMFDM